MFWFHGLSKTNIQVCLFLSLPLIIIIIIFYDVLALEQEARILIFKRLFMVFLLIKLLLIKNNKANRQAAGLS